MAANVLARTRVATPEDVPADIDENALVVAPFATPLDSPPDTTVRL